MTNNVMVDVKKIPVDDVQKLKRDLRTFIPVAQLVVKDLDRLEGAFNATIGSGRSSDDVLIMESIMSDQEVQKMVQNLLGLQAALAPLKRGFLSTDPVNILIKQIKALPEARLK